MRRQHAARRSAFDRCAPPPSSAQTRSHARAPRQQPATRRRASAAMSACLPATHSARLPSRHAYAAARRPRGRRSAVLPPSACADCRRGALIPACAPRVATTAATAHAAPASSTRLHSLPRLVAAAAAAPPDDAALDAYLDTLKWDDKGLLVAIAQARPRRRLCTHGSTALLAALTSAAAAERGHGRDHDAGLRQPSGCEAHADDGQGALRARRCAVPLRLRLRHKPPAPPPAAQATFWTRSRQQLWTKGETSECVRVPRRCRYGR